MFFHIFGNNFFEGFKRKLKQREMKNQRAILHPEKSGDYHQTSKVSLFALMLLQSNFEFSAFFNQCQSQKTVLFYFCKLCFNFFQITVISSLLISHYEISCIFEVLFVIRTLI